MAKLIMKCGWLAIVNTQLHNRNIGLRIEMHKHTPSAVINAAFCIFSNGHHTDAMLHGIDQGLRALRRILHIKQRLRKTAKIMNSRRMRRGSDRTEALRKPMCRNAQNCSGPWLKIFPYFMPSSRKNSIANCIHWRAMPQKQHRHRCSHRQFSIGPCSGKQLII